MFSKNKNKKVGLCVMVVTGCFILAGLWAVLATPETALAHKDPENPGHSHGGGGGGGGGKDKVTTCVQFDDPGSVMGDQNNAPYYHNKKDKITVKFSNALSFGGHLLLQTNSTDKANVGRGLFINFGTPVILAPGTDNEMIINTTDEALANPNVLGVSANLRVGAHQEFDFFNMEENPDSNVNLRIRVVFDFKDGSEDHLFIRLDPDGPADGTGRNCLSSDPVTVTYGGIGDGLRTWRVETLETAVKGACLSRSSDCDESSGEECPLEGVGTDPDTHEHIALSFGFTVTAPAP